MVALGLVFAVLLAALPGQEASRVFVEVLSSPEAYESQPVDVVIRIGYDAAWFEEHGVALIRQEVDVPFHLMVPWLLASPGRDVRLVPFEGEFGMARVPVGDQVVAGVRQLQTTREGRTFEQVEVRCRWLPLATGTQEVAPVSVRFAYANQFREHLLRGREPVDRQEQRVASARGELRVLAIPSDAPPGWSGAVGEFAVDALSGGEQVHVGGQFVVEVTIHGDGNLGQFPAIKPPSIDGFYVQGVVEEKVEGARKFILDVLALRPGVTSMPGVSIVTFSPAQGRYVTTVSDSVPVRVIPRPDGLALSKRIQQLVDEDAASQQTGAPDWIFRWGFIVLMLLGLWVHRYGRTRNSRRSVGDAVHALRVATAVGSDPERVASAYERVISQVAGGGGFSTPGVWQDLEARGVAKEGLDQLRSLHAELDAARFGGPLPDAGAVMDAVETLVAAC